MNRIDSSVFNPLFRMVLAELNAERATAEAERTRAIYAEWAERKRTARNREAIRTARKFKVCARINASMAEGEN